MPRKPRQGHCVYCGSYGQITSDHVPPKCLFPPDARLNLVTVPACPNCHDSFKLDDEYFRVVLSLRADLPEGPDAQFLRDKTKRTLGDPSAERFRAAIQAATVKVPLHSTDGVYVGNVAAIKLQPERIDSTADRIVRGLYAKYFKRRLPDTHAVSVNVIDFQKDSSAIEDPHVQELLVLLGQHGTRRAFGNVLELWFLPTDEDHDSSIWWVRLHGAFGIIGFTLPKDG